MPETQYQINHLTYSVNQGVLHHNDEDIELDPRVSELLNYFLNHPNEVISREQLLDNVWQGVVVTDNSLSWSISQLRKAFKDNAKEPEFIKTVAKRGYQFIADIKPIQTKTSKTNVLSSRLVMAMSLIVLATLVIAAGLYHYSDDSYQLTNIRPLTALNGLEEDPKLSSDNKLLLFRHKRAGNSNLHFQLYIKPIQHEVLLPAGDKQDTLVAVNQQQKPIQLTSGEFNYRYAIWGHQQQQLFAVRTSKDKCEITEIKLTTNLEIDDQSVIRDCHKAGHTKLVYDQKSQNLIYTDKPDSKGYLLYQISLADRKVSQLYQPEHSGFGVRFVSINKQQHKLLILTDREWSHTHFISLNLDNSEPKELVQIPSIYYQAYFSPDGTSIWLNWGNQQLIDYEPSRNTSSALLQSSYGWNYNLQPVNRHLALFTTSAANKRDLAIWQQDKLSVETTEFNESLATVSPNATTIAYLSDQTGLPQIWLKDLVSGESRQLTHFNDYKEFQALTWSNDGSWLLGATKNKLGAINVDQEKYVPVFSSKQSMFYPQWSIDDKHIQFSELENGNWKTLQISFTGSPSNTVNKAQLLVNNSWLVHQEKPHQWLFSKPGISGIFRLDLNTGKEQLLIPELPADSYWILLRDQSKVLYRTGNQMYQVHTVSGLSQQLIRDLPQFAGNFSASNEGKTITFTKAVGSQSTIKAANIKR